MRRLILIGGGHAHFSVLQALADAQIADLDVTLITPEARQVYSGMLPGWMAGHYAPEQFSIDLHPLAVAANVKLIHQRAVGIDADRNCVILPDGEKLEYDFVSLDIGSETNCSWLESAGEKLCPIKPLKDFCARWPKLMQDAQLKPDYRLLVVGGGAAGVELVMAAKYAFNQHKLSASVALVTSEDGLLAGHSASVIRRVRNRLKQQAIDLHMHRAVGTAEGVLLSDGTSIDADVVIAATGSRAQVWLQLSKLSLDEDGYIIVDQFHRSVSHPNVFAGGDICARQDVHLARSGVHAVFAGPVIAQNLLACFNGTPLKEYRPKNRSLYLLSCGSRYAIASWGRLSAEGVWVWKWKNWIDQGFIARFSRN